VAAPTRRSWAGCWPATIVAKARALRGQGYRTALISNNAKEPAPLWRAKFPVDGLFDEVVDSARALGLHAVQLGVDGGAPWVSWTGRWPRSQTSGWSDGRSARGRGERAS
jgi:hypothetical protein